MQPPSIGRIVHYVAPGSADGRYPPAHRAAIITEVIDAENEGIPYQTINLMVFNPTGAHWVSDCPYDGTGERPFSWHYPEKVWL